MPSKHIALIYTGGTVGMTKTAAGYAPMPDFESVLAGMLGAMPDALPEDVHYTFHQYATPIDSTNADPADWRRIAGDIAARYDRYDGFVVLHGTDTMAYTAAALSFVLRGLRKPVILTGSQIPLSQARSDALQNVVTALRFAASDEISEVAIYFNQRLLRGNRATKISASRFQAFDTPCYPWLGEAGIALSLNRGALLTKPAAGAEKFELLDYAPGRILSLRFTPGLPVQAVQAMLDLQPQALILEGYGAGNVPDREPALLDLLAQAHRRGIVLAVVSQSLHGEVALGAYATGSSLARTGAVGVRDMRFEAVFAKLHHLFASGLTAEPVRAALLHDHCGELTV